MAAWRCRQWSNDRAKFGLREETALPRRCGGGEVNGWRHLRARPTATCRSLVRRAQPLFARGGIYDERGAEFGDNAFRFGLLAWRPARSAATSTLPDVVHVHDRPTAVLGASWTRAQGRVPFGRAAAS
jgi:hypothetical protein